MSKAQEVIDLTGDGDSWRTNLIPLFEENGDVLPVLAFRSSADVGNNIPKIFASLQHDDHCVTTTLLKAQQCMMSILGCPTIELNWSNIILAGGAVLGALEGRNKKKKWRNGDVDVFIYGCNDKEMRARIMDLWKTFGSNLKYLRQLAQQ